MPRSLTLALAVLLVAAASPAPLPAPHLAHGTELLVENTELTRSINQMTGEVHQRLFEQR